MRIDIRVALMEVRGSFMSGKGVSEMMFNEASCLKSCGCNFFSINYRCWKCDIRIDTGNSLMGVNGSFLSGKGLIRDDT